MKDRALGELRVDWTEDPEAPEPRRIVDWTEDSGPVELPVDVSWTEDDPTPKPRLELPWQRDPGELPARSADKVPPGWPRPSEALAADLPMDLFGYPTQSEEEPVLQWRLDVALDRLREERRGRLVGVRTVGWMLILFIFFGMGKLMLEPHLRAELAYWLTLGQAGQASQAARVVRAKALMVDGPHMRR